jgi:hypothetical protein
VLLFICVSTHASCIATIRSYVGGKHSGQVSGHVLAMLRSSHTQVGYTRPLTVSGNRRHPYQPWLSFRLNIVLDPDQFVQFLDAHTHQYTQEPDQAAKLVKTAGNAVVSAFTSCLRPTSADEVADNDGSFTPYSVWRDNLIKLLRTAVLRIFEDLLGVHSTVLRTCNISSAKQSSPLVR